MNRIHSNSDSAVGVTALTHHHLSNVSCVSSGSLGKRQHRVNSTFWRWQRRVPVIREN